MENILSGNDEFCKNFEKISDQAIRGPVIVEGHTQPLEVKNYYYKKVTPLFR